MKATWDTKVNPNFNAVDARATIPSGYACDVGGVSTTPCPPRIPKTAQEKLDTKAAFQEGVDAAGAAIDNGEANAIRDHW